MTLWREVACWTQLVIYPGEQSVEAVDLLPLGDVGIILSNALQSQLLHQVYLIGFLKVLGLQQGHITSLTSAFKTPGWNFINRLPYIDIFTRYTRLHSKKHCANYLQDIHLWQPVTGCNRLTQAQIWAHCDNSLDCSGSQVAPSHPIGWVLLQLADCSP